MERLRKKSKVCGRVFLKVDQLVGREIAREPRVDFVTWLFFQPLWKCFYRK